MVITPQAFGSDGAAKISTCTGDNFSLRHFFGEFQQLLQLQCHSFT
ncbi:MAG: hypothetical protein IPL08_17850 [Saprospiraceae bacterium]|nr:hypothetical protein [Saprospiraceae bacterium]